MADVGELLYPVELDPAPIRADCLANDARYRAEELARVLILGKILSDSCPSVDSGAVLEVLALMIESDELRLLDVRPERDRVPEFSLSFFWQSYVEGLPEFLGESVHRPWQSETVVHAIRALWSGRMHFRRLAWVSKTELEFLP